jgi:hypothetical protein
MGGGHACLRTLPHCGLEPCHGSPHATPNPFPFEFNVATTALVIIDMQRDFIEPGGFGETLGNDVSLLSAIVPACRACAGRLARRGRPGGAHARVARGRPVGLPAGQAQPRQPRLRIGDVGPMGRILVAGEPGNQIIPALAPVPGEIVIDKPGKGAFYATPLHEPVAAGRRDAPAVHGRDHRGLRADQHARGQRPRLRLPAAGGLHRELLSRPSRRRRWKCCAPRAPSWAGRHPARPRLQAGADKVPMRAHHPTRPASAPHRSRADEVYAQLKQDVAEFKLVPGDRFTENELCERLGVSAHAGAPGAVSPAAGGLCGGAVPQRLARAAV